MASSIRTSLIALLAAVSLAACGSGGAPAEGGQAAPAKAQTRTVQHDAGTAEVPVAPKRVVSVSVTMTGHLLALEAPVVASQATAPGPITDGNGFFKQWADVAAQRGVQVLYQGFEPDLEKVIAARPDLIVGAATGADSAAKVYDKLQAIAPTVLFRHDNLSWQDLSAKLGRALGLEAGATELVGTYDARVAEVKGKIKAPEQEAVLVRDNNTDIPVFTDKSAQGGLLASLGFAIHPIDASMAAESSKEGGGRTDIVNVAQENVVKAFGDSSIFFVSHSPEQIAATSAKPLWKDLPAVTGKRVYDLGLDSFRIDYYSATNIVDRIEQQFS
ncbi:Fe2+-enterobactin ABC transporter substrate-binding protein [Nonomuraea sp. SBT364]|uniref:Fe2+-enterobactin ABC transporter substrate-binding protein n=1 Tax=Nonomuraea sp. SBT364 TaxID=1580530 RepID=UPI00066BE9FD|nr:Fe2+-enterobactin ABC transporter substrate-binding protein [Nonomuraea sp. SBT364]